MPRRLTAFQKAVYYVKQNLAGSAHTVTESKMLRDRISGQEREVDIVIESEVAGHNIVISVECREQGEARTSHLG